MATNTSSSLVSRRDIMRGAAGLGLVTPLAFAAPMVARAQDAAEMSDFSGHPAIGAWTFGLGDVQFVLTSDGLIINCEPPGEPGQSLGRVSAGVWEPRGDRTAEYAFLLYEPSMGYGGYVVIRANVEVSADGQKLTGKWAEQYAKPDGTKSGWSPESPVDATRITVALLTGADGTPEATPAS